MTPQANSQLNTTPILNRGVIVKTPIFKNYDTPRYFFPIPSLVGLSSLQALLHRNRFSSAPPSDFFAGLSSLQSIYVDDNPFDPWSIPANLKDAATLVNFFANSANVSGELQEFLATAFPSLDHLALAFNLLSGPIPAAYAAAPFRSLWLNNQLGNSRLSGLLLHRNRFSGAPPSNFFADLSSLQSICVDDNPFDPWSIPANLKDAATLVNFSANSTNVSGELPEFLAIAFPSLDHLALAFKLLSGPVPGAYAAAPFRSLWLNNQLGSSRLSGSIAFVANMTSIEELLLHSNDFSGPLPDFSALQKLADLQLRDNRLTGPIPASLTSLNSLKRVTLTNNLLQGPFY